MATVGIWEREEEVSGGVRRALAAQGREAELLRGEHPAEFGTRALDLLCLAPGASGWAGLGAVDCRILLLPGVAGPLAKGLRCQSAVSYGTSPKDTLTLSSLEGDKLCLSLQREVVTVEGKVLEQQEILVPLPPGRSPLSCMAETGALLLLGAEPGKEDGSGT